MTKFEIYIIALAFWIINEFAIPIIESFADMTFNYEYIL